MAPPIRYEDKFYLNNHKVKGAVACRQNVFGGIDMHVLKDINGLI